MQVSYPPVCGITLTELVQSKTAIPRDLVAFQSESSSPTVLCRSSNIYLNDSICDRKNSQKLEAISSNWHNETIAEAYRTGIRDMFTAVESNLRSYSSTAPCFSLWTPDWIHALLVDVKTFGSASYYKGEMAHRFSFRDILG